MKKIYTFCLGILITLNANSQVVIEWQNTIGGSGGDYLRSVKKTYDGGFILGGSSDSNISGDKTENSRGGSDYWIVKTDGIGQVQWEKTFGGSGTDYLNSLQQTYDGGYILAGSSNSNISGDKSENSQGGEDYWIIKLDGSGNIIWQNTIGGGNNDKPYSIIQTSDHGYVLSGASNSNLSGDKSEDSKGGDDYWVLKLDSSGNVIWQKTIGGSLSDLSSSIMQTNDGGFILAGHSSSSISGDKSEDSKGNYDYWIIKLDTIGNIEWQKTIGGSGLDELRSIEQTTDGGFILGGTSDSYISGDKSENSNGYQDYWLVKIDMFGNLQWQNTIGGSNTDTLNEVEQTNDGGYIIGGSSMSNISGDKTENSKGVRSFWILKIDSVGDILWQKTIGGYFPDFFSSLEQTSDGNYFIGGHSYSGIGWDKTENSNGVYDYWIMKLTKDFNTITGTLFVDINSNNIQNIGEPSLKNKTVSEVNTGRFTISDINGFYELNVLDTGNFTVSILPIAYYTTVPTSHTFYFTSMNQTDSLNDFAFQPNGVLNDLQITLNPLGAFRPGFNAYYIIHYENSGTSYLTGSITFKPDSILSFVSSQTPPTSITPDSIVWNIPILNPFDEANILVKVNVSSGAVLGSTVNSIARIEPVAGDAVPANNESTWQVIVTGSYDPNDILVNRETVTTTELLSPPYLDYLIRFQNTGTDTAFTVKIKNPLPVNAQLNTFEFLESSHPVQLNYSNAEQLMLFQFDNILLPDSNTNELLSHGYVRYRIKPKSTLTVGDLIENSASIFFDFNAPIYTNTAITEIVLPSSVPGIKNNFDFNIYPNPSTGEVNISFTLTEEKEIKIELFNALGQIVKAISQQKFTTGKNQINFSTENLSKGIYHIKFSVEDDVVTRKLVKM